jgi:hypothetical protein
MMGEIARRERHVLQLSPAHLARLPGGLAAQQAKIEALKARAVANQRFLDAVTSGSARERVLLHEQAFFPAGVHPAVQRAPAGGRPYFGSEERNLSKVRSTLHQMVRDWGAEGAAERAQCYEPLLRELVAALPVTPANRFRQRVLVPGAGLGRLAFEIVSRGYATQGNEFSYHMLVAGSHMLNRAGDVGSTVLYPWIDQSSNVASPADMLRAVAVPDVCCADALQGEWLPSPPPRVSLQT